VTLSLLFLSAIGTNLIGIFGIFGAFVFGAVLCDQVEFRKAIQVKLKDFVTAFFLPIFFAYTGLRTNIGSLDSLQLWLIAGGIISASIIGKIAGCGLAAYFSGFSVREASCIGVLMNTRALMELIVINLGKDFGIISDSVFCMLVMMALITTFMTTPILKTMVSSTEFEPILKH
jgi:Kef-type K+ transport system membrane component KefB